LPICTVFYLRQYDKYLTSYKVHFLVADCREAWNYGGSSNKTIIC